MPASDHADVFVELQVFVSKQSSEHYVHQFFFGQVHIPSSLRWGSRHKRVVAAARCRCPAIGHISYVSPLTHGVHALTSTWANTFFSSTRPTNVYWSIASWQYCLALTKAVSKSFRSRRPSQDCEEKRQANKHYRNWHGSIGYGPAFIRARDRGKSGALSPGWMISGSFSTQLQVAVSHIKSHSKMKTWTLPCVKHLHVDALGIRSPALLCSNMILIVRLPWPARVW